MRRFRDIVRGRTILAAGVTGIAAVILAGCASNPSSPESQAPATIIVDAAGGGDYGAIGPAIAAAAAGDTVLVMPGTYAGPDNRSLDFRGRNIVLRSRAGSDSTIIDCEGESRAVYLHSGEGPSATVEGFAIRNGAAVRGGAVHLDGASPTLVDLVLESNTAESSGAGIYVRSGSPSIARVVFRENTSAGEGGGLFCEDASPVVDDCDFMANEASAGAGMACIFASPSVSDSRFFMNEAVVSGGAIYCGASSPSLTDLVVVRNDARNGGGIALSSSSPSIDHATVAANHAVDGGGIYCEILSSPTIRRSVIAFNVGGGPVFCSGEDEPDTRRSCFYGNDGGDVACGTAQDILILDPLFCNLNEDDVTVCANSPCLPDENPWNIRIGALSEGCAECDATRGPAPWRVVRTLYRH
jgi:predicted outer membrane repeat protein